MTRATRWTRKGYACPGDDDINDAQVLQGTLTDDEELGVPGDSDVSAADSAVDFNEPVAGTQVPPEPMDKLPKKWVKPAVMIEPEAGAPHASPADMTGEGTSSTPANPYDGWTQEDCQT